MQAAQPQSNGHNYSFEIGHIVGSRVAKTVGDIKKEDIQALGIRTWQRSRNTLLLDLEDFVQGYQAGYTAYMDGII